MTLDESTVNRMWRTTLSTIAAPLAPVYGLALAYLTFHPPRRTHRKRPQDVGLVAEDVAVPLGKRRSLHAWLCPADRDAVVVMGHGIGMDKSTSLAHAKLLHDAGYTVCLFDHRNHGLSSRDRSWWSLSERFTDDVAAVVEFLRTKTAFAAARYAVYGFSFSSFPSFYVLRRAAPRVDAVVCDSGPADDLLAVFRGFLESGAVPLPGIFRSRPSRPIIEQAMSKGAIAMLGAPEWPPAAEGGFATTAMLFVASGRDTVLAPDNIAVLAKRYPKARVGVVPAAVHLQGLRADADAYGELVLDFLNSTLRPSPVKPRYC